MTFLLTPYGSLFCTGWACKNYGAPSSSHIGVHLPVCSAQRPRSAVSEWAETAGRPVWCDGGGGRQEFPCSLLCLGFLQWILSQQGHQCHQPESHHHLATWGWCLGVQPIYIEKKLIWVILLKVNGGNVIQAPLFYPYYPWKVYA